MKLTFHSDVRNDRLQPNVSKLIAAAIKEHNGKRVTITIDRCRKTRSNPQNAYYWGVVLPIIKQAYLDTGWRKNIEDIHAELRVMFSRKEVANELTGEIATLPCSTTELSTSQFMEYLAEIGQWAAEELGCYIPEPNEQTNLPL